jgi:hypothetical protein
MPSKSKANFDENKKDIDQLWAIHEEVAGGGPGRKHGVDVLLFPQFPVAERVTGGV